MKSESKFYIDYLGSSIFCLEGFTQQEVEKLYQIENMEYRSAKEAMNFLFPTNNWNNKIDYTQLRIIVSPYCNGWIFVKCELNNFTDNKNIITNLITKTSKKINFYLLDDHSDFYSWILSKNGEIYREFFYSMGKIINCTGDTTCEMEQKFEIQSEWIFGVDVYEEVAVTNGATLPELNEKLNEIGDFMTGTFNINAL